MATVYVSNLVIYTGTKFEQTFALEDSDTNSVKDLTGYNGCAQIKRYESSKKSADFTVSFANDRTSGRLTITMLPAVTSGIKAGKYFYDILLNSPAGITTRVVEGVCTVKQSVTR